MKSLKWGAEYNIGIKEIDSQHEEFVNIINKLCWAEEHSFPIEIGVRLVYELIKYAEFHFTCEENMMFLYKYGRLSSQIEEHKKLLGIMQMKMNEFKNGSIGYDAVSKFAFMWLISHTVEEDKKFGDFMKSKVV